MPAQAPYLAVVDPVPRAPGATFLDIGSLSVNDLVSLINGGPLSVVTSLAVLKAFFYSIGPFAFPSREVTADDETDIESTDVVLLVNKASPTTFNLPTPSVLNGSRLLVFKDMGGNSETYNITLDAGAGKLINGQQTLVMNGNYGTTMLISMSSTKWGTLI